MNIFKLCFLICKYNSPSGIEYDKQKIHEVGNRKFSLLHKFCFTIVQLPGPTRLKISWLENFNQDYIKILGNYILSFQITKKHSKIHGLKYYLPKVLIAYGNCHWKIRNRCLIFIYLLSLPYQESHLQAQGCQDIPLHPSK